MLTSFLASRTNSIKVFIYIMQMMVHGAWWDEDWNYMQAAGDAGQSWRFALINPRRAKGPKSSHYGPARPTPLLSRTSSFNPNEHSVEPFRFWAIHRPRIVAAVIARAKLVTNFHYWFLERWWVACKGVRLPCTSRCISCTSDCSVASSRSRKSWAYVQVHEAKSVNHLAFSI